MGTVIARGGLGRSSILWIAAVAVIAVVAIVLVRAARPRQAGPLVMTEAVTSRDITVTIEATGTVEPIDLVEVKSKASGQIVRMPVEVGSAVGAGDLLAQIDTRDVRNEHDQARAALRAAEARVDVSQSQKKRADELFARQMIAAVEHETAVLGFADAQAAQVKARTDLDLARQRLEDATVRAPIAGTVLEQMVSTGQVISSATSSASGGTSLLKMADLSRIRLRALVSETDIGNVRAGQPASVVVEAYPQRTFEGRVEKIEPQAVVQQSVTMFPVLISIANDERLLLPGMNGEVTLLVEKRENVTAVPVDAVRGVRELAAVAAALDLDPDSVRAQVARQSGSRPSARSGRGNRAGGASTRAGGSASEDARTAFAAARGPASDKAAVAGSGARASRAQVVFVQAGRELEPRVVRIGLSDFDYAEVLEGVKQGEKVVLLGIAEAQAQRTQEQDRIRQRVGTGVPGMQGGTGGSRGGGTGGGGSGRGSGGASTTRSGAGG